MVFPESWVWGRCWQFYPVMGIFRSTSTFGLDKYLHQEVMNRVVIKQGQFENHFPLGLICSFSSFSCSLLWILSFQALQSLSSWHSLSTYTLHCCHFLRETQTQMIKAEVDVSSLLEDRPQKHEKRGQQWSSSMDWDAFFFWNSQFCHPNAPSLSNSGTSSTPGPQRANSVAVFSLQCKSMLHCLPLACSTLFTLKANSNSLKARY